MAAKKKTFYKQEHSEVQTGFFVGWTKPELLVWISLRTHENAIGRCFPGYKTIERETGLHPSMVAKGLKLLEARKVLTVNREKGAANRYTVHAVRVKTEKAQDKRDGLLHPT